MRDRRSGSTGSVWDCWVFSLSSLFVVVCLFFLLFFYSTSKRTPVGTDMVTQQNFTLLTLLRSSPFLPKTESYSPDVPDSAGFPARLDFVPGGWEISLTKQRLSHRRAIYLNAITNQVSLPPHF